MKLVAGIMPTRGRNVWSAIALNSFLSQTYPAKHLIILDDADDPSFREVLFPSNVAYLRIDKRLSIPEKRNMCCQVAAGDIIMHVDSDDWSDPGRMAAQVHLLEESGKAVAGFHSLLFHMEPSGQVFKYVNDSSYALGTSLCYRKSFWQQHPFRPGDPNPNVGEDNQFVKEARQAGELVSVDAGSMMVARIHGDSTSPHDLSGTNCSFRPVSRDAIPAGFWQ